MKKEKKSALIFKKAKRKRLDSLAIVGLANVEEFKSFNLPVHECYKPISKIFKQVEHFK